MIQAKAGVPVDKQWLMYDGRKLEDWYTLSHYHVPKEATLSLISTQKRKGRSVRDGHGQVQ